MDILQTMAQELLWARDKRLGYPKGTLSNDIFAKAIHFWGQSPMIPAQVPNGLDNDNEVNMAIKARLGPVEAWSS